jgi:hypothetical protein
MKETKNSSVLLLDDLAKWPGAGRVPDWLQGLTESTLETPPTLESVDLRRNDIARLPYAVMNTPSKQLELLVDGNPVAEAIDWSGEGIHELPVRMVEEG